MNILIYGSGAVGLAIGSCLLKAGEKVSFIARKKTKELLQQKGLIRSGIFGNFSASPEQFTVLSSLDNVDGIYYDYIFICTKSYDSVNTAKDIYLNSRVLHDKSKIILFQNGWGNAEVFLQFFPKNMIYNARVITGFQRPEKNHSNITVHVKPIHVGSLFGADLKCIKDIADSISNGGIPCQTSTSVDKDLWAKMLFNCSLNPLGAILGKTYGELANDKYARVIMDSVIKEIFGVMNLSRYRTYWINPKDYINAFYSVIVPPASEHKSSTLQDLNFGKKTEIDALNGAIVQLAKDLKINVPFNLMLYKMIKLLESRY